MVNGKLVSLQHHKSNNMNPTYKEVYTDQTGYAETVHITYDEQVVGLEFLLNMFFKAIDPVSLNKQGHDEGTRYRTGVYYVSSAHSSLRVCKEGLTNYLREIIRKILKNIAPQLMTVALLL